MTLLALFLLFGALTAISVVTLFGAYWMEFWDE
jgi:hypothetical protein